MGGRSKCGGPVVVYSIQNCETYLIKRRRRKSASSFVVVVVDDDDEMGDNTIIMEFALYAVFLLECVQEF